MAEAKFGNVDMFVTMKTNTAGNVYGEAEDAKYAGAIEITGFAWGMATASDLSTGMGAQKRQHKPLRLYKSIDAATCPLAHALSGNQVITELTLTARKGSSHGPLEYLVIKIKKGRVVRLDLEYGEQTGGNGNGREVAEITYQEIEINYTPQSAVGLSKGPKSFTDEWMAAK